VELYRVFPYVADARPGESGHPLYVHPPHGNGRWDNPELYRAMYLASSPAGAIGETFAHLSRWTPAMLPDPLILGAVRALGVYRLNEETTPLLDLDDAAELSRRGLRPTDVVKRNRPRRQDIAKVIFSEERWAGLTWWSMHRPQWTLHAIWDLRSVVSHDVEPIPNHVGLFEAAELLGKELDDELR
jgi:hypothetical protein